MQKVIVAIGGGHIRKRETLAIDREILRLSCRESPKVLFIPTASFDREDYRDCFRDYYGGYLGCRTDELLLVGPRPSKSSIAGKIADADVVYVGGGCTLMMMRLWRRLGVDALLRRAYENGTVMAGVSAGSICWFEAGHSDSMWDYNPQDWKYIKVKGLGLIEGIHCPHYNGQTAGVPRRGDFRAMMAKAPGMGIAIENNCAIEFVDSGSGGRRYRVIASKEKAQAYRVFRRGGRAVTQRLPRVEGWTPASTIYER